MYGIFQRLQRLFTTRFVSTKQNKTNTLKLGWIMATLAGRFKQNSLNSNVCKMFELLSFIRFSFSLIFRNECVSHWTFMVFHLNFCSFCYCSFVALALYYGEMENFLFHSQYFCLSNVMPYNGHFYLCLVVICVFFFASFSRKNKHGKIHARKQTHVTHMHTDTQIIFQSMWTWIESQQRQRWKNTLS